MGFCLLIIDQLIFCFFQSEKSVRYPRIKVDFSLSVNEEYSIPCTQPIPWEYHTAMEEISYKLYIIKYRKFLKFTAFFSNLSLGPACWLWDYLRRSKQGGFFLPLSGGIDSCSTACIVFSMCNLIYAEIVQQNENVLTELRKIVSDQKYAPTSATDICSKLFITCYMGTENSSEGTKERARSLANQIGSTHLSIVIDVAVRAVVSIWTTTMGVVPRFKVNGGTNIENLALQNIQSRLRMVLSYFFAQLSLWAAGRPGSLLVLGSANVDESLRGYFTKYDCSSADLNPIGSISKTDLRSFILYCSEKFKIKALKNIYEAPPTAELEPLSTSGEVAQLDEVDMGMTYDELSVYGKLRKQSSCGPFSMFCSLLESWSGKLTPKQVFNFFNSISKINFNF